MTFNEIIEQEKPTLVDFYAEWCGPCKWFEPTLDELGNRVGDKATILKIDVDLEQELVKRFKIKSVPTLVIFKGGEIRWRQVGAFPVNELERLIKENL